MNKTNLPIQEGDIYEVLTVCGKIFEIRYGYYEDFERDGESPIPIYPDLEKTPIYGTDGKRIVTFMQDPCEHFIPQEEGADPYCGCCKYYDRTHERMVEPCRCEKNNLKPIPETEDTV